MKKTFLLFVAMIIATFIYGCGDEKPDYFKEFIEKIEIPNELTINYNLPLTLQLNNDITATIIWTTEDENYINNDGSIIQPGTDVIVILNATVTINNVTKSVSFGEKTIIGDSEQMVINNVLSFLNESIPISINDDIELIKEKNGVGISWASSNSNVLTNTGKCYYVTQEVEVTLTATLTYQSIIQAHDIIVKVNPYSDQKCVELVFTNYDFKKHISANVYLPSIFDYGVKGTWSSDYNSIIDGNGTYHYSGEEKEVTLTLTLRKGDKTMERDFVIITKQGVKKVEHLIATRDFTAGTEMENVRVDKNRLVLKDDALLGHYVSEVIETKPFVDMVASWAAITSKTATCQLFVRVRVDDVWSEYIHYGVWGLGLINSCIDQTTSDGLLKLVDDEMMIQNNKTATAYQFKIILNRTALIEESPMLTLVAGTLRISGYTYDVDVSGLPEKVDYDIPKLNQNIVPSIGNIICSPTSSTMLLMYHGHDFSNNDSLYPHRYIAGLAYDSGNRIYGNWVYNTVTMGAFGETSYVRRMYSWEELKYHLATVGPVAASIRGNTGLYTTNGHLLVVRGYVVKDGKEYVICNDPNLVAVYYEYPLETFKEIWYRTTNGVTSGMTYIIE